MAGAGLVELGTRYGTGMSRERLTQENTIEQEVLRMEKDHLCKKGNPGTAKAGTHPKQCQWLCVTGAGLGGSRGAKGCRRGAAVIGFQCLDIETTSRGLIGAMSLVKAVRFTQRGVE